MFVSFSREKYYDKQFLLFDKYTFANWSTARYDHCYNFTYEPIFNIIDQNKIFVCITRPKMQEKN